MSEIIQKKEISRLCFGTWGIAGSTSNSPAYGFVDLQDSLTILEKAIFEYGIDFFDTSPAYSEGKAEELLGYFNQRKNIKICTKVGRWNLSDKPNWDIARSSLSLRASKKRLKQDTLDIVLIHSPEESDIEKIKFLYEFLLNAKASGEIKELGISLKSPENWETFRQFDFSYVQVNFNLLDVRALKYFCEWHSRGIKVLGRGPYASGILTNKEIDFKNRIDHRSRWNSSLKNLLYKNRELLIQKFPSISIEKLDEIALQFVCSFDNIAHIVVSILTLEDLVKNVATVSLVWPKHINRMDLIDTALNYFQ